MRRIKRLVLWIWHLISRPAATLSLGFLTLGGFVGGVMFWGAFNTALEATNTETFCTSCHEMKANVFEELSRTVHFSNRSGVRASCPDCHVPHDWTDKIARKMQASKNVINPTRLNESLVRTLPRDKLSEFEERRVETRAEREAHLSASLARWGSISHVAR